MEDIRLLKIEFDMKNHELSQGFVEVEKELSSYNNIIGSRMIDIVSLNRDIAIIVDDEGLLVSGNPVFDLQIDNADLQLAGTLLIGSQMETDEGVDLVSLRNRDFLDLAAELHLSIVGVTV